MDDEKFEGLWALVLCTNGAYLGCLSGMEDHDDFWDWAEKDAAGWFALNPAFEYLSQLQQGVGPEGQPMLGRVRFCSAVDDMLASVPVWIHKQGTRIIFFDDMKEEAVRYKAMIKDAQARINLMRAEKSGITLAAEMPSITERRRFRGL